MGQVESIWSPTLFNLFFLDQAPVLPRWCFFIRFHIGKRLLFPFDLKKFLPKNFW